MKDYIQPIEVCILYLLLTPLNLHAFNIVFFIVVDSDG